MATNEYYLEMYKEATWAVQDLREILFTLIHEAPEILQNFDHDLFCHLGIWLDA